MGEYLSFDGLAFQAPGGDIEDRQNIHKAVGIVRDYITTGGAQSDVEHALAFILKHDPKTRPVIENLRLHLFTEDLFGWENHDRVCKFFFNQLVKRVQ